MKFNKAARHARIAASSGSPWGLPQLSTVGQRPTLLIAVQARASSAARLIAVLLPLIPTSLIPRNAEVRIDTDVACCACQVFVSRYGMCCLMRHILKSLRVSNTSRLANRNSSEGSNHTAPTTAFECAEQQPQLTTPVVPVERFG